MACRLRPNTPTADSKPCLEYPEKGQALLEKYSLDFWNGRWASPEEMGYPLAAIGSKLFSYMSGQVIYLDYGTASLWEVNELEKQSGPDPAKSGN